MLAQPRRVLNHFKPNVTITFVDDFTLYKPNGIPAQVLSQPPSAMNDLCGALCAVVHCK